MRHHRHPHLRYLEGTGLDHRDRSALANVLANADRVTLPAGRVLARQGRTAEQLVVVIEGDVDLIGEHGSRTVGAGEQIGVEELLTGRTFETTSITRTATTILVVHGAVFRAHARKAVRP